ncbi:C4-type zinc ribbon domain-containing protein [Actinomycetota bacterium]|nr:C4-type zinc ribbon domain-containing protein [Actinomycetota bacterium]
MNIDLQIQVQLLAVQGKDTEVAQLEYKRSTLPAIEQKKQLEANFARARDQHIASEVILSDLQREALKSDGDVDVVRLRITKDQEMLDSGAINDPKQLTNLQHELESLAKRQLDLEDVELEIMERVEGAKAAVQVLAQQKTDFSHQLETVTATLDAKLATLAADLVGVHAERVQLATDMPPEFLALYEKIRKGHEGMGAAKLHRGQCEGCRLTIPPQELNVIRSATPETVIQCEECRCILIRTADSGI